MNLDNSYLKAKEKIANCPLLLGENLGKRVQKRWIWQNVSFELLSGEGIAIAGASGTGKSLLLRAIAGLDPLQAGQITFDGQLLGSWSMPRYRTLVVYLHQRPALLEGTVEENLRQVYQLRSHKNKLYNRQQILDYLEVLGRSADFLTRHSSVLSGGEAQLVAFLRALQLQPLIFLFDEPTTSLDAQTTQHFEALVENWLTQDQRRAYLWTSHDPAQLERMTNRSINLHRQT